jgi:hypothetical protein
MTTPAESSLTRNEDGTISVSISDEALRLQRERERLIALAKDQETKRAIAAESDIFRLVLIFYGVEGRIVKTVVGKNAAATVLQICRSLVSDDGE